MSIDRKLQIAWVYFWMSFSYWGQDQPNLIRWMAENFAVINYFVLLDLFLNWDFWQFYNILGIFFFLILATWISFKYLEKKEKEFKTTRGRNKKEEEKHIWNKVCGWGQHQTDFPSSFLFVFEYMCLKHLKSSKKLL